MCLCMFNVCVCIYITVDFTSVSNEHEPRVSTLKVLILASVCEVCILQISYHHGNKIALLKLHFLPGFQAEAQHQLSCHWFLVMLLHSVQECQMWSPILWRNACIHSLYTTPVTQSMCNIVKSTHVLRPPAACLNYKTIHVAVPGRNRTLFCILIALPHLKRSNAELLLRVGLICAG